MMLRLLQVSSIVVPFGLGSIACSGAPDVTEAELERSIVGGEFDTRHTNVFGMVIQDGEFAHACTATLIAPNLLLTARHCVSIDVERQVICGQAGFGATYPPEALHATNAPQFRASQSWVGGSAIHVPAEGDDTCGFDIALVVLASNVPAAVAKPAVPRIDREVVEGEPYVAVGYGISDDGRSGSRMVRSGLNIGCDPGSCGFGVQGSEFVGDTGVCEGDSGGPALDEDGKVVGVVSRGAENCSLPIYGSVTAWRDLIFDVAVEAADMGGYEVPFWVTSGSSDPPPEPEPPPKAGTGEPCLKASDCAGGNTCHMESAEAPGSCVALCSTDEDCEPGSSCLPIANGSAQACVERAPSKATLHELKSSCALHGAPARPSLPLGAFFASLLFAIRRKRRIAKGSGGRSQ